ncbi:proteasome inhibitor PI31 subunit isoform X2 [Ornithorhynchus anatinus]|uniref:proteasome inhibitor PI31 subunit isoform X2 n=1 Tax=Ornithorhynchus anatinus TaxID=9258 RepID=UPI0010A7D405|nr:proteasome inhibitor PI31 subunit isoform X2 [Ornithorhynchus anatinus]
MSGSESGAGLELLFRWASPGLARPHDALLCFVHWELVTHRYRCLGAGDQAGPEEEESELLPAGWNADPDLFTLRYRRAADHRDPAAAPRELLLKAVPVDGTLILNAMECNSQQVVSLTLNVADYVDEEHLQDFHRVYKDREALRALIASAVVSPLLLCPRSKAADDDRAPRADPDPDPLRGRPPHPDARSPAPGPNPLDPFAVGRADLDPFGGHLGGMIMDPLRSGYPRPFFDPSSGLPNRLPPGAVPPGARFDPFGPNGTSASGPTPDHLPPPGFDNMFL